MARQTFALNPGRAADRVLPGRAPLPAQARPRRLLRPEQTLIREPRLMAVIKRWARPARAEEDPVNQQRSSAAELIRSGGAILGIEFGSTRIKASLIAPDTTPLASGSHAWENQLKDGVWTYDMEDVWNGPGGLLRVARRGRAGPVLAGADDRRGDGLQRDDARVRSAGRRRGSCWCRFARGGTTSPARPAPN